MDEPRVAAIAVSKRLVEPDVVVTEEVLIRDYGIMRDVLDLLEMGEEVVYYARSAQAPVYSIRELDSSGNLVEETRIVNGNVLLNDAGCFLAKHSGLAVELEGILKSAGAKVKHQKLSELRRQLSEVIAP